MRTRRSPKNQERLYRSIGRELAKAATSEVLPKFKVGQHVVGVGRAAGVRGRIRSVIWDSRADVDLNTGKAKGAFIINLDDGNYGGEDYFETA